MSGVGLLPIAFPVLDAPTWLRVVVGLVGLALTVRGAALGQDAVRVGAMLAGMVGAVGALFAVGASPAWLVPHAFAGVVLLGGAALLAVEAFVGMRTAMALTAVVTGAVYARAVIGAFGLDLPDGAPLLVGGLLGLVWPWVFETIPRVLTPMVGAVGVTWALGWVDALPVLVAVWGLLGVTVQWFTGPETIELGLPLPRAGADGR